MFKVLILPCIGIVLILQFRSFKESKNYRINERNESFYIDTNGKIEEYINSNNLKTNRYEH
jgi:hypothetical protein